MESTDLIVENSVPKINKCASSLPTGKFKWSALKRAVIIKHYHFLKIIR